MADYVIGYPTSHMTMCPYLQYTGTYNAAVAMFLQFNPPMNENDEIFISPEITALETALTEKAGRLVIVGGTYNKAKRVFVANFVKELEYESIRST